MPPSRTRLTPTWTPCDLGPTTPTTARPRPSTPLANGPLMARGAMKPQERSRPRFGTHIPTWALIWERVTGIEPALSAWEADVLPLNYTRAVPGPSRQRLAPTSYRNHRAARTPAPAPRPGPPAPGSAGCRPASRPGW